MEDDGELDSAVSSEGLRYKSSKGKWVITASVLGSGMAAIDATVVGIALPTIGRDFHAAVGALQWVVTGYTLSLAALLLLGGSLGDHYGRRRVFCIGVIWFALSSGACGLADGSTELIFARVLQGIGAALLTPGSLAILQASFAPQDRGRAIGAWSGLGGLATAAGPLLGGYLIAVASWRWVFFINIPLGVLVLVVALRHIPESKDPTAKGRIDFTGGLFGMVFLAGLTYSLIEGPERGWTSPVVVLTLVIAIVALIAFVLFERATKDPMLPFGLFRERQFTAANATTLVVYAALGGSLFLLPVDLQVVDHYSPLESGMALLPVTVVMLLLSARSGRIAGIIGPRLQMSVGPIVVGIGLALLTRNTTVSFYPEGTLPGVLVFALGLAITVAPLTSTAMGAVPVEHSGLASAVNNDVARVGGLIAVAILPALSGISGTAYLHPEELAGGFRTAMLIAASWCAAGGLIAAAGIRNPPRDLTRTSKELSIKQMDRVHCALEATPLTVDQRSGS